MALIARYLIDTSAAARMRHSVVAARLAPLIEAGVVATCAPADTEALYSARSSAEYEQIRTDRRGAYEYVPTKDQHWQAAFEAQRSLARTGPHRAIGVADLLTAALAGQHQLTLVHYDTDFDIAREVITFESQWVAQRGSLP
ncbi:MAG: PIN domain-containing protein [Ornithinimicrobium sp.]